MPKRTSQAGSDLFIVDNSDEDWKVVRYLHDWCQISKAIDAATGYFEIGSLLSLKDEWQKVDKIRILMGDEVSLRTKNAFAQGLTQAANKLDQSIEREKEQNDFLVGVPAIVEAIRSGKIECRLYRKEKFHAKAYITHARLEVVGSSALVGSSNFTYPGLHENIELNVQITGRPVSVLQEWYEEHWKEAEDVTPEILKTMERHTRDYLPFEVYAKALYEFFLGRERGQENWETNESVVYRILSQYQRIGYHRALQIAELRGGALLCDGVGLGKTFIGLMLIEHYLHQGKRVLLLVPKSALQSVWERWVKRYLRPHYGRAVREQLYIHTHTQLEREGTVAQEDYEYYQRYADAVIVDEAHHFRNAFRRRSQRLYSLTEGKKLYLLTATPINNKLLDLYFLICYFIPRATPWESGRFVPKQDYFSSIGIRQLRKHFDAAEAKLDRIQNMTVDEAAMAGDFLRTDELLRAILIQRSRRFVRESEQQSESAPLFPMRRPPHVIEYSLKKVYAGLYEDLVTAFNQTQPLLTLAAYNSEAYRRAAPDESKVNYQAQVVGLIRTLLLKRIESSYRAFEASLEELLKKMVGFLAAHDEARFQDWVGRHRRQWDIVLDHQRSRFVDEDQEEIEEDDLLEEPEEILSPEDYDLTRLLDHVVEDMAQVVTILTKVYQRLSAKTDDKLTQLVRTLQTNPRLSGEKVVIFTEFRDTARYLYTQLKERGVEQIEEVDSSRKLDREKVIKRFSPYYNEPEPSEIGELLQNPIRLLISTDVLSEGLNLQDAQLLINYDLHWNPVRLMQRIGRVDRRLSPEIEATLGRTEQVIEFWNFLPPAELEQLLGLFRTLTGKVLRINRTLGIEGALLTPDDPDATLKNFNERYEGQKSAGEELELELHELEAEHPDLFAQLPAFPGRVFSGKKGDVPEELRGVFCAYRFPPLTDSSRLDSETSGGQGEVRWYFRTRQGKIVDDLRQTAGAIRCLPLTPRAIESGGHALSEARRAIELHIKDTHLKTMQAPMGYKPVLVCWMEVS